MPAPKKELDGKHHQQAPSRPVNATYVLLMPSGGRPRAAPQIESHLRALINKKMSMEKPLWGASLVNHAY